MELVLTVLYVIGVGVHGGLVTSLLTLQREIVWTDVVLAALWVLFWPVAILLLGIHTLLFGLLSDD